MSFISFDEAPKSTFVDFNAPPPPPDEGGFKASVKQSIGSVIKGAGQAAGDFIPGVDQDNAVKRYGQEVIDANPTAVHSLEDIADKPMTAVKEATGNAAGSVGGILGARALGMGITAAAPLTGPFAPVTALAGQAIAWFGPVAIAALPSYGGIRDKQVLNDPTANEDWKAKAVASLGAATVGAIETRFGPQQWALAAMTKEGRAELAKKFAETTVAKGIGFGALKGAAIEGGEELVQNPIEQLAGYDNPLTPESLKETAFGGVMGAIGGGVLGGGTGAVLRGQPQADTPATDPIAPILQAQTVDEAIAITAAAIDTPASLTGQDRATLMTPPANGLITAARGREADAADLNSLVEAETRNLPFAQREAAQETQRQREVDQLQATSRQDLGRLPDQQVAAAQAATDETPTAMQLAMQRALAKKEPNVSPETGIQPSPAVAPGRGLPEPAPGLAPDVGVRGPAPGAVEPGRAANQPNGDVVPPGTVNLDALKGENAALKSAAIEAQQAQRNPAPAGAGEAVQTVRGERPATEKLPAAGAAGLETAGLSARQVAINAEKARMEEKRAKRKEAAAEASKPMEGLSVGSMPTNAEPVSVKDGVVYIGKYAAQNFETGRDVTVPAGASPAQIAAALKESGALGKRARVFGLQQATVAPAPRQSEANVPPAPGQRQTEIDAKADEIMSLFDKMGGGIAITRDQVRSLIAEKGMDAAEKSVRALSSKIQQDETTGAKLAKMKAAAQARSQSEPVESLGKSGPQRSKAGDAARGRAMDANPFKAFIAKHGISIAVASEFAPGRRERQAALVQGYGPVFRKSGQDLDRLAQNAVEEGFLKEHDVAQLSAMIHDVLRGKRHIAQYAQGAAETEMDSRAERAAEIAQEADQAQNSEIEAEARAEREAIQAVDALADDTLRGLAEDENLLTAGNNVSEAEFLRAMGASEQEISDATAKESARASQGDQGRQGAEETAPGATPGGAEGSDGQAQPEGLTAPTQAEVLAQQDRADQAEKLDQREQVRRESEAGAGQFDLTREEGRRDNTGDLFNQEQPSTQPVAESLAPAPKAGEGGVANTRGGAGPVISDFGEKLIQHTTQRGKVLSGYVFNVPKDRAAEIDPYTFRKDGGYFIRKSATDALSPDDLAALADATSEPAATAKPATPTEPEAPKHKASSLRALGQKMAEQGAEEQNRERNTNTARRASMAAGADAKSRATEAMGKTLVNLADAIERGDAPNLVGFTTKAQVEALELILRRGMRESEKHLSYAETERLKGRAPDAKDVANASLPDPRWGTGGSTASAAAEALKGKRGAKDLAQKVRYSSGPTPEILAGMKEHLTEKELQSALGWWNIETLAELARMDRAGIKSNADLRAALSQYIDYRDGPKAEDPIKAAERKLIGQKVGFDFFPTPKVVASRMVEEAGIKPGMRVLEPSAGNGNIADVARAAGADVDAVEISSQLRDLLQAKGYSLVGQDFMDFTPAEKYDAVLMNPPFSNRLDAEHIQRAYGMLKPGGKLVAIAGEGVFTGSDKKARAFQDWLAERGATIEKLPAATFTDTQLLATTGANARMVVIDHGVNSPAGPVFAKEPTTDYTGRYETDLFGNPLPAPAGRSAAGARQRAAENGNVRPAAAVPGDTQAPAGDYFVRTIVGVETNRQLGADKILTPADAAQATAYLYKNAVERLDAIVTDKKGRPLGVVGGFKGAVGQASVYPSTVVGEAVRIPGAAHIWFSHNHPSGSATLSRADEHLSRALAEVFHGSGIQPMGLLAVSKGRFQHTYDGNLTSGDIPAPTKGASVPVIERHLAESRDYKDNVNSPGLAKQIAARFYEAAKSPGLVLLDSQLDVAAWVPLPENLHGPLRNTGGLNAIYRAVSESNASSAFIVHGGELSARGNLPAGLSPSENIAAALAKVEVRPIDSINVKTGESAAERGMDIAKGPVYSRGAIWRSALKDGIAGINAKALTGAMWADGIKGLVNKGAVKADEVEWSGITDWLKLQEGKVTKEQVLQFLDQNGIKVEEVQLTNDTSKAQGAGDRRTELEAMRNDAFVAEVDQWLGVEVEPDQLENRDDLIEEIMREQADSFDSRDGGGNLTEYGQYQLPGGENYREVLLTLPEKDKIVTKRVQSPRGWGDNEGGDIGVERSGDTGADYRSSHWRQPNVLAHIRVNDRTDADGKRVLFVEEIQSDWSAQGRKQGFSAPKYRVLNESGNPVLMFGGNGRDRAIYDTKAEAQQRIKDGGGSAYGWTIDEFRDQAQPPSAPFVGKTEAYVSLALKRIIKMAADEGYDKVAFVNGEQSADRYDLSKHVNYVDIGRTKSGAWEVFAHPINGGQPINRQVKTIDEVAELVGKDLADKAADTQPGENKRWNGLDLKVGGEGMKAFYDKIVPSVAKDVLRKLGGGKMESVGIAATESEIVKKGHNTFVVEGRKFSTRELAQEWVDMYGNPGSEQPGFTITPAMREHAAQGMPMFAEGAVRNPTTITRVQSAITDLIGGKQLPNQLGRIVATTEAEIKSTWEPLIGQNLQLGSEGEAGVAQAFYDGKTKTVFLIADHIEQGTETAVLAHELIHKYGQDVLGKAGWDRLHGVLNTWKDAEQGSEEYAVYAYARGKVEAVGTELSNQEMFPYAVEAAVKMGIKPSMAAKRGTVANWLESVRQNMKQVWGKLTGKPETFKAQDLVDLAFAIAQRENPEHASALDALQSNEPTAPESGGAFSRGTQAPTPFQPVETKNGTAYRTDAIALAAPRMNPRQPGGGLRRVDYQIRDQALYDQAREAGMTPNQAREESHVGSLTMDVDGRGQFKTLRNILIFESKRGNGTAGKVVGSIMASLPEDSKLRIHDILPTAVGFWDKMGAKFPRSEDFMEANLSPQQFRSAYDSQRGIAGTRDQSPEPGAANEAGAGQGRPGADGEVAPGAQDITDSPAFKKWFGDSKVVDSAGKPLVVYHGTAMDFDVFGGEPKPYTRGYFFSDKGDGTPSAMGGTHVMPVYLSLKNPMSVSSDVIGTPAEENAALKKAKALGYDGLVGKTPAGETIYVAIAPGQIKSAIGNNGNFDAGNPDIRYSRTQIVGQTNRQHTPAQLRAMKNVGFQVEVPTLKERAKALWQDAGKKMAQGLVDQFAPVKDLDRQAYGLLRLAKGASGAFEAFLHGGKLKLTDGVYDFDDQNRGGVVEKLLIPLQGEHHDFFRWIAANRAERLTAEGKENLFSPQDIADLKTLADSTTEFDYTIQTGPRAGTVTRDRTLIYADAQRVFNEFNKNVLDLAEQSGLIDGASRHLWEHEFYVPFYRVSDEADGGVRGMNIKGGVVRQEAFKALKGGKNALNADLLDNTLMNWAHLLDAAAKNRAAKATIEAGEKLGAATQVPAATKKSVWFMDAGQKHHAVVSDPYLLTAITSLEYAGMRNPVMNAMGAMKHVLTIGVTASPFFKVRNLIRDSVQVLGTSKINPNPLANVAQGWKLTDPKSDAYFRLLAGGGTIHFGTMLEGSEAKRVQALVESGVEDATILNDEHKVKAFYRKFIEPGITAYNELGNRGEAINRASLYDQLVKQGMSHADASLQARDLMDFSMQGSFTTIRFLTQTVPFLNARMQGLYKLGRAAKEDPARFSAVIGAASLMSLALLAAYSDDDDWKKREEWDRNNYWWFKFGGTAFRIPKPFEIGAIATLAERGFELAFDKEMTGKRFRKQVLQLLSDNLAMNPLPQLVKPVVDIYANNDSFTGRPIESMGMERLKSEYRFTDRTSMTARVASTGINAVTGLVDKEGPSPVQIDHMLRSYFGWLGAFVVGAGDVIARPTSGQPGHPASDMWKVATGGMVSDMRDAPSRYVSQMYTQAKEIEQAYGTWRALQKEGKTEEAKQFLEDNRADLSKYHSIEAVKRQESKLNERIRMIERSNMDGDAKRDLIRTIQAQKDRVARQIAF